MKDEVLVLGEKEEYLCYRYYPENNCGLSSKIDPLFRLNLTHPNVFRVWVSFFIISDFYTVI